MKYIIFTTNKLGFSNFELYIVDAEGKKEPVRVTYSDGFDGLASFSPDGKKLTWTSARGAKGDSQIWIANWNHEAALAALEAAPPAKTAAKVDTTVHPTPVRRDRPMSIISASKKVRNSALFLSLLAVGVAWPQATETATAVQKHVEYLASEKLEGRMTGTEGRTSRGGLSHRGTQGDRRRTPPRPRQFPGPV
jgi:hypothetical protein